MTLNISCFQISLYPNHFAFFSFTPPLSLSTNSKTLISFFKIDMASKAFTFDGEEFVTNNYVAILENTGVDADFHKSQDLLRMSEVGFRLTNPSVIYGAQVLRF